MENVELKRLFGGTYAGRRVLVTGHTGFKGSWLVAWLRAMEAQVSGLALDPDTSPSHWHLIAAGDVVDHRVDLRDATAVRLVVDEVRPEVVFHLAAQPLVRRSYREPTATFATNVDGLVNLLEAVRGSASVLAVVVATTDKVYANADDGHAYRESDPLGGHDPYSSSKACAELVAECYRKSFFQGTAVRLATARAGNVIGGGDWAEDRLVPDLVHAAVSNKPLRVRNPAATRPWQHVLDPLAGYLRLGQALLDGDCAAEAWNFGPEADGELAVSDLAQRLGTSWPALRIERDVREHPHEAHRLRLDCSKAKQHLAWKPVWSVDEAVTRTAQWYRAFHESGRIDSLSDLAAYVAAARHARLGWAT